jgi:GH24 family phage-related lysozyme (muramidase)
VRELIGKNKSRPETVTTRAPIAFVAENHQGTRDRFYLSPQGTTTDGAGTQSHSNPELASVREERISNVVGENGNGFDVDGVEQRIGVEKTGQELEDENLKLNQYDCDPDLSMIGRQI